MNRIFLVASSLISVTILFYILIVGKDLLIPFIIALVFWYLINSLKHFFGRLRIGKYQLPGWLRLTAATLSILAVLTLFGEMISYNAAAIMESAPIYAEKIQGLFYQLLEQFSVKDLPNFTSIFENFDYASIISSVVNTLSGIAGNMVLILIYVGFLLVEQSTFAKKLDALFPDPEQNERVDHLLVRINKTVQTYLSVKTVVSLLTGFLSYIILALVGVDFAVFWAILIFLLNYIPTVGSLIATTFPALLALVQFDTFTPFLIVLIGVGAVQLLVGNVIEPKMMGQSLNVSPLVVILSLSLWGAIWGVPGMILCVPIMVILMIILAQFPMTQPFAILLSADGQVGEN